MSVYKREYLMNLAKMLIETEIPQEGKESLIENLENNKELLTEDGLDIEIKEKAKKSMKDFLNYMFHITMIRKKKTSSNPLYFELEKEIRGAYKLLEDIDKIEL